MGRRRQPVIVCIDGYAVGWNKAYSGMTYYARSRWANGVHAKVKAALLGAGIGKMPFKSAVHIDVTAIYPNRARLLDPDNVAAKLYIDGLKGWVLEDDTARHVASVTTRVRVEPKGKPRVELRICPVEEED